MENQRPPEQATAAGDAPVDIAGERLILMPERTIHWPGGDALIVADTHFGKGASFRKKAIAVPRGTTEADLRRLGKALARTAARRLVLLGDFIHAKTGWTPETFAAIARWRGAHADLKVILVRGNHDWRGGDPPEEWRFTVLAEPYHETPFRFSHFPGEVDHAYTLAGHIHPAVWLRNGAGLGERLPCYYFGRRQALVPAFGSFTGCGTVWAKGGARVFVIADDEVISVA
jgi:DNA ligase-associated metallophosphoesterase